MRRIFIQFYLILVACFVGAVLISGTIYSYAVQNVSDRYLNDIFRATMRLLQEQLEDEPVADWNGLLADLSLSLPYPVKIEPLDTYTLSKDNKAALLKGDIVMLEESFLFLQRVPKSRFMVTLGPIAYLSFLRQIHAIDLWLMAALALFMGVPAFLWMRPLWRQLMHLNRVAARLGAGNLDARVSLPADSGVRQLGDTFNVMADNLRALVQSRRELLDAVSHELRTPIARLRYRLEMLPEALPPDLREGMDRDITAIDRMIEELLLYSRLDRQQIQIQLTDLALQPWLGMVLAQHAEDAPALSFTLDCSSLPAEASVKGDPYYLERALSNLLRNATRYAKHTIHVTAAWEGNSVCLWVDDDGDGIPEAERARIFEPFIRLDTSRDRRTGGYGLGLAIVQRVLQWHGGTVTAEAAPPPLSGARFKLCWPRESA